ncbi:hypothetical protein LIER_20095 [Lithospermum erythrorhizon]|uniref:Uncharacterized protein n=1 Tax=Lithospermum erythrorhizon TaxID=34254 RepID=A0AAV3QKA0_LITER
MDKTEEAITIFLSIIFCVFLCVWVGMCNSAKAEENASGDIERDGNMVVMRGDVAVGGRGTPTTATQSGNKKKDDERLTIDASSGGSVAQACCCGGDGAGDGDGGGCGGCGGD